jgi:hypothetical protein
MHYLCGNKNRLIKVGAAARWRKQNPELKINIVKLYPGFWALKTEDKNSIGESDHHSKNQSQK